MKIKTIFMAALLTITSGVASARECTAADRELSEALTDGINAGRPEHAILNPCSSVYLGKNTYQMDRRIDHGKSSVDNRNDGSMMLIDGSAIVARRFAPPASTTPQLGLFSVGHNVER